MSGLSDSEVGPGLAAALLALPTLEQQVAHLCAADLLTPTGISALLDLAAHLVRSDPGKGQLLAERCAELAAYANLPAAIPRAAYIRAQAHASNSEFDTALALIETAHAGYLAIGEELEALRTHNGRMNVLIDLGQYQAALDTSQMILGALERIAPAGAASAPRDARLIAALAQQNRGVCYVRMGRHEQALEAYAAAEALFVELGLSERVGDISNNRGDVLVNLGRCGEALEAFETARLVFAKAGLSLLEAQTLINIGEAHLLLSNYTQSLEALKRSRELFDSLNALSEQHVLLLLTAEAYLALNLYPEALAAYREAERLSQAGEIPHYRARAGWGVGTTLIAQSQLAEAELALAEAAELYQAAGNQALLSSVKLEQAALLAARSEVGAARQAATTALDLIAGNGWPVQQIYAHMRLADLAVPDLAVAEQHLLAAQRISETLVLPHLRYRLNQRLGHIRLLQGRAPEAQALLERAIDEIEHLRGTLAHELVRASFLRDKVAAYENLVELHLERADTDGWWQAFLVAERAKSRALVDMLTSEIEPRSPAGGERQSAQQRRALQADLNAIYNELLGSAAVSERTIQLSELQARAAELEQAISRLELHDTFATAADALAAPPSLDTIRAQLPPNATLLAYHIVGDEIMAFICARGEISAARQISTVPVIKQQLQLLAAHWDRFRGGAMFTEQQMWLMEQSAQRLLLALYDELVAPLDTLLEQAAGMASARGAAHKLLIVPHGLLHQVPFHALYDGLEYLLDRFEISYAPSATVLALCQARTPGVSGRALVLGVADPLIPAVTGEARAVARQLQQAELYIDSQATLATFHARASGADILHVACHGLFRAGSPMFSALKLSDGWLLASDVMQHDLTGALVVLSACESGRSEVIGGDEILGLTRVFLSAGATTIVVSLWVVQDATTAELMSIWYEQLHELGEPATALRAAQLMLKERHPHPYYWAPFVLVGRR
jgi:CHAT domain-containing protein